MRLRTRVQCLLRLFLFRVERLVVLDQFLDANSVGLRVPMTRQWIRSTGGFDEDVRPENAGLDVNGSDLADADADLVAAEPRTLPACDRFLVDFDDGWEKEIAARPTAGLK